MIMDSIHVDNLPPGITEERVQGLFSQFGIVQSVQLEHGPDPDRSRAYAFVTMKHEDAVRAIRQLDGLEIEGRNISVNTGAAGDPHRPDLVE